MVADVVSRGVVVLTGRVTRIGYVYSAVAERVAEACWLFALWLLGAPAGLLVACGAVSWLYEYTRSRTAETGTVVGAGHAIDQPGTRAFVACAGLVACGLSGAVSDTLARGTATLAATVWLLLAVLGFTRLLSAVRRALT
jgi:CDP-diacylglycerol--glycerol-3-phosphate 3-phosphatidyltransferase